MSYLASPRIHFTGRFQADTSTVNNDVRHFNAAHFRDEFQLPMEVEGGNIEKVNGYWNPEGSGAFRLVGCKVTSTVRNGYLMTSPEQDPAVGLLIGNSAERVAGKLVDLDPQQQTVSQIWGMSVRLQNSTGMLVAGGEFEVAPLCDLWLRQQNLSRPFDQRMAAAYQSVLTDVEWMTTLGSPCLEALQEQCADRLLSIRMNLFGYDRTPGAADYRTGIVVGTIGPVAADHPRRFVFGRQLIAASANFVPKNQVANIQATLDEERTTVTADFGNALPTVDSSGALQDIGDLAFGILKQADVLQGAKVSAEDVALLGTIPYREPGWLFTTAGVQDFSLSAHAEAQALVGDHPLAVVQPKADGTYTVMNRETADGLYVRADQFVFRLNAGEEAQASLYACRYGSALAATIATEPTSGFMGGAGTGADLPADLYPIPDVNTPDNILHFPAEFETSASGRSFLTLQADPAGPGNPRGYIDGQLYGIAYQIKDTSTGTACNPLDYISVLIWNRYEVPDDPNWFEHIQPILQQFGDLYPIMSRRLVNLGDYASVVAHADIMKLCLSLPIEDPNSMPTSRDLSLNKRLTILKWLDAKDPHTGLPPRGVESPRLQAEVAMPDDGVEDAVDRPDIGDKYAAIIKMSPPHRS